MEKFTNDSILYFEKIVSELEDFKSDENWKIQFHYVEVPSFLNYGFSFCYLTNQNDSKLIYKKWNAELDAKKFQLRIYHLDRLAIVQKELNITQKNILFFNSIDLAKVNTIEYNGIVLDGYFCKMTIPKNNQILEWNINKEMNSELKKLVSNLRLVSQNL